MVFLMTYVILLLSFTIKSRNVAYFISNGYSVKAQSFLFLVLERDSIKGCLHIQNYIIGINKIRQESERGSCLVDSVN